MAIVVRKAHFLVALLASFIDSFKRLAYGGGVGGSVTGTSAATTATVTAIVFAGHVRYTNPATPDLVSIVAALDPPANGAMTIAAQPVVPCKLQVRIVYAGTVTGSLVLVGVGARGQAVTQTIALAGGTRTVTTTDAYASLTSATLSSVTGAASGDTVGIGQSSALGLPAAQGATLVAVHRASVDDVREAVGTVDATAGTIVPTTAPNGSRDFDFWYTYTVTPVQPSHTHDAGSFAADPASSAVHFDRGEYGVTAANASSLATSLALTKALITAYNRHISDALAHRVVDGTNVLTATRASVVDLASAITAANEIKAAFNAHRAESGVHGADDAGHEVTASNATIQSELNTLTNALKTAFNAHIADGMSTPSWRTENV